MKMEKEITALVTSDYNTLKCKLENNGFKIKEEFSIKDVYMLEKNLDLNSLSNLEILQKCILVRNIINIKKVLLYKYKKYASNGDIIEQGKVECPIGDIESAINFMQTIGYKKLFNIYDKCIVFANDETELVVQLVNDKYIFIELEDTGNKKYSSLEEMKQEIIRYDLPIDKNNFFVKKAEIILSEIINKNSC